MARASPPTELLLPENIIAALVELVTRRAVRMVTTGHSFKMVTVKNLQGTVLTQLLKSGEGVLRKQIPRVEV